MTAAMRKTEETELERVLRRLHRAASDLESAAMEAGDAIDDIKGALENEDDATKPTENQLAELVVKLHDDEHEGPIRWCTRDVCRRADEALS